MSSFATLLVIFSAFLHASWNLLGKKNLCSAFAFTFASSAWIALLLFPYLIWYAVSVDFRHLNIDFLPLVIFSGLLQILYLLSLTNGYKHGDISVIYPLARALPVLLVAACSFLLGHSLTSIQWLGFTLITLGCCLIPLTKWRQFNYKSYANLGVLWALLAALGTTGYSIIDKAALSLLNQAFILHDAYSAVFYLGVQAWATILPLLLWCWLKRKKIYLLEAWKIRKDSFNAGIMMASTYGLVLFAITMTDNVSLIVALRQISIVFGVLLGISFLKEKWYITRFFGITLILIGLILSLV